MKNTGYRAFSLIELLVVISIIILLAAFAAPAVSTMMRGTQLAMATDNLEAMLSYGRQAALTKNHQMEVRFYQFGDPETPGESVANPSSGKYRAVQVFQIDDSGNATAVSKCLRMPGGIIMDSNSTLSPLLGAPQTKQWINAGDPKVSLPEVGKQYNCCVFRFLQDGSANLAKTSPPFWCVTLHGIHDGDNRATPPANYATVQLDPNNGSLKVWRP